MNPVHFKYDYRERTYRITATPPTLKMLIEIKAKIANTVKGNSFVMHWRRDGEKLPLKNVDDLLDAITHANMSGRAPSCVNLIIEPNGAAPIAAAAAAAAAAHQPVIQYGGATKRTPVGQQASTVASQQTPAGQRTVRAPVRTPIARKNESILTPFRTPGGTALIKEGAAIELGTRQSPRFARQSEPVSLSGDESPTTLLGKRLTACDLLQKTYEKERDSVPEPAAKRSTPPLDDRPDIEIVKSSVASVLPKKSLFGQSAPSASSPITRAARPSPIASPINAKTDAPLIPRALARQAPSTDLKSQSAIQLKAAERRGLIFAQKPAFSPYQRKAPDNNRALVPAKLNVANKSPKADEQSNEEVQEVEVEDGKFKPRWLLLQNAANDCFLNAAIQYMRRATDLSKALEARELQDLNDIEDEKKKNKATCLRMLKYYMKLQGTVHPRYFRAKLAKSLDGLEDWFLYTQQDAYEILCKIFDQIIPVDIDKKFHLESCTRRRCVKSETCTGNEKKQPGSIHYQHIERNNQACPFIVDLESLLSSEWTAVEGENEPRHCSECCECCRENKENKEHNEDKCKACKENMREYVEENCFNFKGDSNYALVAFNILHPSQRMDWSLAENCDLDGMKLMGRYWRAVSVIEHSGRVYGGSSSGHYVAYTRQDDELWYIHDDDTIPSSIGSEFRSRNIDGTTDMSGVMAILFEKK